MFIKKQIYGILIMCDLEKKIWHKNQNSGFLKLFPGFVCNFVWNNTCYETVKLYK